MTANGSKSHFSYLNKLVYQYNNTDHHSINKKSINADYSVLSEKIETNIKAPKFKVNDRVRITKYKNQWMKRRIFVLQKFVKRTENFTFSLDSACFRFTEISYFLTFSSKENVTKQHLFSNACFMSYCNENRQFFDLFTIQLKLKKYKYKYFTGKK